MTAPAPDYVDLARRWIAVHGETSATAAVTEAERAAEAFKPLPLDDNPSLPECRRRREYWLARRAELEVQERTGELVERAVINRVWYEETRRVRDRLLSMPASLAGAVLSCGGDLRVAEEAIRRELAAVLLALADEPTAPATTACYDAAPATGSDLQGP